MEVAGKRVLVVGLGKSGVAAARFLAARGARVTVSDSRPEAELGQALPELLDRGITVETGRHGERTFRDQDLIVVSPGVPVDVPQLVQARAAGVRVIGEIELAARHLRGRIVAVTGSNGKTTTTSLIGAVLAGAGKHTLVGGNIGRPALSLVEESTDASWVVLEVSSFQLETIETFRPHIAVLLNVTPDHLDRHRTFETYVVAKARMFENQGGEDFAVLNADDPTCAALASGLRAQVLWFSRRREFSRSREVEAGAFVRAGAIFFRDAQGEREVMPVAGITLKGAHNLENVLAAVAAGMAAGCAPSAVAAAASAFRAVEHRLEYVATRHGVEFYNDSKATNVDATVKALEAFPGNIHLILGGKDKGSDYTVLQPLLRARVKCAYTVGAAAEKIEQQIAGATALARSGTIERAVKQAAEAAAPGDTVLLAPACASFDQFESYEHRGRVFKQAVAELGRAPAAAPVTEARRHG
jgi:UDP-N-acetylmuramoylalanine--D-glutamate ligase